MSDVISLARKAHETKKVLTTIPSETKNACLLDLSRRILAEKETLLEANASDLQAAEESGLSSAKVRRLRIDEATLGQIALGLTQIADLPDPVGQTTAERTTEAGLRVRRIRSPLGVILMIYEARPNVTVDAFSLCFKAGNACILKGGREAEASNFAFLGLLRRSLESHGIPTSAVTLIPQAHRDDLEILLRQREFIDLVIPRGGAGLIRFVREHSSIPIVDHEHGVCHIFVDEAADLRAAERICVTAKTSAPATCNSAETILVHRAIATEFVPRLVAEYRKEGVEVRGDEHVASLAKEAVPAEETDWGREFLDLVVAVRVVEGAEAAIDHIHRFGSNHTDAIVTEDPLHAKAFTEQVQSSCTLVNASTRFNDGFQLGLGAEIGISTTKIHAYGPMGLEELTTERYVVHGSGNVR